MATPTIKLQSVDGKIFTVDLEVAKLSLIVTEMLAHCEETKEGEEEPPIPLNVTGDILEKVVQWCEQDYRKGEIGENEDGQQDIWNTKFLDVENQELWAITRAANYLDIKGLLDICCKKIADQIEGKMSPEIRKLLELS